MTLRVNNRAWLKILGTLFAVIAGFCAFLWFRRVAPATDSLATSKPWEPNILDLHILIAVFSLCALGPCLLILLSTRRERDNWKGFLAILWPGVGFVLGAASTWIATGNTEIADRPLTRGLFTTQLGFLSSLAIALGKILFDLQQIKQMFAMRDYAVWATLPPTIYRDTFNDDANEDKTEPHTHRWIRHRLYGEMLFSARGPQRIGELKIDYYSKKLAPSLFACADSSIWLSWPGTPMDWVKELYTEAEVKVIGTDGANAIVEPPFHAEALRLSEARQKQRLVILSANEVERMREEGVNYFEFFVKHCEATAAAGQPQAKNIHLRFLTIAAIEEEKHVLEGITRLCDGDITRLSQYDFCILDGFAIVRWLRRDGGIYGHLDFSFDPADIACMKQLFEFDRDKHDKIYQTSQKMRGLFGANGVLNDNQ